MSDIDVISAYIGGIFYRNDTGDTSHVPRTNSEVHCDLFWREKMKKGDYFESQLQTGK
jgi:hypothetical protein